MTAQETWLVTGASGFFGSNVPSVLPHANLIALTRTGDTPAGFNSSVHGNLSHSREIVQAIDHVTPDYVVHAAALASHEKCERNPDLAFRINATATESIAQAAEKVGSKLIYLSTDAVFSGKKGNYREPDEPHPFSVYGKSKLEGERAVRTHAPESLILRTNFFGWSPTGERSTLEFFVNNLVNRMPIQGYTDFTVTSIYVRMLIAHIDQLKDQSGTWHVTSRDALTKCDFGKITAEIFNLDPTLITPVTGQGEISRSRDISLNTDKLQQFFTDSGLPPLSSQRDGIMRARQDRQTTPHQPLDSDQ